MLHKQTSCLKKQLVLIFVWAALLVGQHSAAGQTPTVVAGCNLGGVSLAHCESSPRNFKTVLLAVHGWGGSCQTTFGEGNKTLFNVLPNRFFDIDCFEYDSLGVPIGQLARNFSEQIKILQNRGYQEVYILTHSMGGLVALQAYTDVLLQPDNTPKDFSENVERINIAGIDAWAVPIDGLRDYIIVTGTAVEWVPFLENIARYLFDDDRLRTDITVPEMEEGSAYLTELKNRLSIVKALREGRQPGDPARRPLTVGVVLHVGQASDLVVNPFDISELQNPTWKWDDLEVFRTDETHSNNIGNPGESGDIGLPRYPAEIVALRVFNRIPLLPRTEIIFPQIYDNEGWADVPKAIEERQLVVVNALSYVSGINPGAFDAPIIQFLDHMYNKPFPRSSKVDQALIDGLLTNLVDKIPNRELAEFYLDLIYEVFVDYDPADSNISDGELALRFGSGYESTEALVLDFVGILWRRLKQYLDDNPDVFEEFSEKRRRLLGVGTQFADFTGKFLNSRHDSIQRSTLNTVREIVLTTSVESIQNSQLQVKVADYLKVSYNRILQPEKDVIIDIYTALYNEPELAKDLVLTANEFVDYGGKLVPIILTLNDGNVSTLHGEKLMESDADFLQKTNFFSTVVARGGTMGSDSSEAADALSKFETLHKESETPEEKLILYKASDVMLRESPYPMIIQRLNEGILLER